MKKRIATFDELKTLEIFKKAKDSYNKTNEYSLKGLKQYLEGKVSNNSSTQSASMGLESITKLGKVA